VSAVSEYLSNPKTYDPDSKFRSLLSDRNLSGLPAEQKMDKLYTEILDNSDWDDKSYVEMYHFVVVSIVALKHRFLHLPFRPIIARRIRP